MVNVTTAGLQYTCNTHGLKLSTHASMTKLVFIPYHSTLYRENNATKLKKKIFGLKVLYVF